MNAVRYAPAAALALLLLPLGFGLAGTVLPAFGYLPTLGGHALTLVPFEKLFATPGLSASLWLSLKVGLVTAAVSLLTVMLFVAAWSQTAALRRVQHLLSPLLAVPHAAAAFGLAFLIAPSGYLVRLAEPVLGIDRPPDMLVVGDAAGLSLMAGLIIKEVPFLFLVTLAALPQADPVHTARLTAAFGYGRTAGFIFATWPRIYRQIRFAVYAVIAYASSVADVAAILGPDLPPTLAVRLLDWMNDADLAMRFVASAGALLQLGVTVSALLIWYCGERLGGCLVALLAQTGHRFSRDGAVRLFALLATTLCACVIFAGIALTALWSVAGFWAFPDLLPQVLSLETWARALPRIGEPLATTLVAGIVSTALALTLTIACLEHETETGKSAGTRALVALYLPLIVPQIAFVFGLQVLFIASGWQHRMAALVFVHLIFVLPYVFLSLSDPWRAFDRRYDLVAAGLGRSRMATLFQIRLPMLLRAALSAAAVGFAVSAGQYLPTVLIGAGRLTTITTEAVALASGGNRRVIGVYAFLQTLLPFLAFAIASLVPTLLWRDRRSLTV